MGRAKQHYTDSIALPHSEVMLASPISIPSVEAWTFGAITGDGAVKSYPITCGGMDLVLNIQDCVAPFDASSLKDASRKTLTLRLSRDWDGPLGIVEAALLKMVHANSEEYFGQRLTEDEILGRYKAITKKMGKYPRNLRVKLSEGVRATRYWDAERARIDAPSHHAGMAINTVVHLRGLWIGADAFGLVCDATDLQILEAPVVECPF